MITIQKPHQGWIKLQFDDLIINASFTPSDPINDILQSAVKALLKPYEFKFEINDEPTTYKIQGNKIGENRYELKIESIYGNKKITFINEREYAKVVYDQINDLKNSMYESVDWQKIKNNLNFTRLNELLNI